MAFLVKGFAKPYAVELVRQIHVKYVAEYLLRMREVPLLPVLVNLVFVAVPKQLLVFMRKQSRECRDDVSHTKNFFRCGTSPFTEAFLLQLLDHNRLSLLLFRTKYGLDSLVYRDGDDRAVDKLVDQPEVSVPGKKV